MRFLLLGLLFIFFLPAKSQEATDPTMLIKINDALNSHDFEQIRSYIFEKGDRKTYCPHYIDNPHYQMEEDNIEIFMNPAVVDTKQTNEIDYPVMYIVARGNRTPFNYYLYLADSRDIYLYDYNKLLTNKSVREEILVEMNSILKDIKKEMKLLN